MNQTIDINHSPGIENQAGGALTSSVRARADKSVESRMACSRSNNKPAPHNQLKANQFLQLGLAVKPEKRYYVATY